VDEYVQDEPDGGDRQADMDEAWHAAHVGDDAASHLYH
jgi:hypothetical protein